MNRYFLMQFLVFFTILTVHICSEHKDNHSFNNVTAIKQLLQKNNHNPCSSFLHLGDHVIAEFTGCINLNNIDALEKLLRSAAQACGATVLSVTTHQFEPFGMTGIAVLQESHISIHTWPEYGYASIDIYTCGTHIQIDKALEILEQFFKPKLTNIITLHRGFEKS